MITAFLSSCDSGNNPPAAASLDVSPPIKIDTYRIDVGRIPEDEHRDAKFKVTNTSALTVTFANLVTTCGCTTARIEKDQLEPGESTHVVATMAAKGRSGPFAANVAGEWRTSNPERRGNILVSAVAYAEHDLNITPQSLDFGPVALDATQVRTLELTPGDSGFHWTSLTWTSTSPAITAKFNSVSPDLVKISVELDPMKSPLGRFLGTLTIRDRAANADTSKEWKVSIRAMVDGEIAIKPASVYLGAVATGASRNGELEIWDKDGKGIRLVSVTPSDEASHFTFAEARFRGSHLILPYTFSPSRTPAPIPTNLLISVNNGTDYTLSVPILCTIKNP